VTYANTIRKAGKLEEAAGAFRESARLLEDILVGLPNHYKARVNLAIALASLGRTEWNADSPSLGRRKEAIADMERGMKIGRDTIAMDPNETMGRFNHAVAGFYLGRALRDDDPRRALETYEEAIGAITAAPQNNSARELRSVLLADASFTLRSLHRDGQARAWLDQAAALAEGLRKERSSAAVDCDDAISRAEADWALALGRPGDAAAWHRRFIAEAEGTSPPVVDTSQSMNNAYTMIHRYGLLAAALRRAGKPDEAVQADAKRDEIIAYWKKKLPENPSVEEVLTR
jgi:tetratricopeptide (TPR) repeat protein